MQDLDLDELHQAVSQMMDKPKAKSPAPKQEQRTEPASAPVVSDPAPATTGHTAADAHITVRRPMPRVPERTRTHPGAMDIIQPATPKTTPPSKRPNRTAPALHPTGPVMPEPSSPAAESIPQPTHTPPAAAQTPDDVSDEVLASLQMQDDKPGNAKEPASPARPKPAPEPKKEGVESWPDPLDFHEFAAKPDAAKAEPASQSKPEADALLAGDDEPAPTPKETPPTIDTDREEPRDTPTATPFVTTKVEKRPLGAYAGTPPVQEPASAEPVAPAESEPPSGAIDKAADDTASAPTPPQETSKSDMAHASLQSSQHLDQKDEADHSMGDLRQMSIPQQYHTAPKEPHEEVHSLYDTKEYQAPPQVLHPARKSGSPWFTVIVVSLIAIAVVAALVAYLMMTGVDVLKLW